jgi:hypothetical protein
MMKKWMKPMKVILEMREIPQMGILMKRLRCKAKQLKELAALKKARRTKLLILRMKTIRLRRLPRINPPQSRPRQTITRRLRT